ncbi:MAG: hypothetical protein HY913_16055 [Desulfomonile tiedjei]|nr:hypothetical protein [Desulfomonile tiedjei]
MRTGAKIVCVVLFVLLMGPINALAAGYERYRPGGSDSQVSAQDASGVWGSVKKGLFVEKYPVILDEAALAVKDLLSQFGVVDKKTK